MRRPTFLVLGGFLGSEWEDLWQRHHEWTVALMRRGNVLYLERAAAGGAGWSRALGRVRKLVSPAPAGAAVREISTPFPAPPEFVSWLQLPGASERAHRANARRALSAAEKRRRELGWAPISFAHVGIPSETWIELAPMLDAPVWFDSAERFLHSAAFADVPRDLMRRQVAEATLVTTDTEITRSDWTGVRNDIALVEHGAKSWAADPDWSIARTTSYYVGSVHPALDLGLLEGIGEASRHGVSLIGEYASVSLRPALHDAGWCAGGDLPRRLSDGIAGLIPYSGGAWRDGVYPSKVYDYFLAGMPAVSTRLPALDGLEWAWQVETLEQAAQAIHRAEALPAETRHAIRDHALANTWERRFEDVLAALVAKDVILGE